MRLDRAKVARATVRFLRGKRKVGQGVVVPGGLIVTAAHVVRWDGRGAMALGDRHVEEIEVGDQMVRAQVYAAEPVSDIAVLGALDEQDSPTLADGFKTCLASIAPVPICTAEFPLDRPVKVFIRTHTGGWIAGRARQWAVNSPTLAIETEIDVEGGTSGGPVVTANGLLLGVVSWASDHDHMAVIPRLHLTAPGWLVRQMRDPHWERRAEQRRLPSVAPGRR